MLKKWFKKGTKEKAKFYKQLFKILSKKEKINTMDKFFEWLFPKMRKINYFFGRDIGGTIPDWVPLLGGKGWKLAPFVMFAVFVSIIAIYHFGFVV